MKLIGKVASVARSLEGKPLVTFEFENADALTLTDDRLTVEIKKYKEKRSLDANAYAWVLMGKIAEKLGKPRSEIYRSYIKEIGSFTTVCVKEEALQNLIDGCEHNGLGWVTEVIPSKIPQCKNVIMHYGSSTYDTSQMSKLIDLAVQDAKELGIQTETPEELARMKEEW